MRPGQNNKRMRGRPNNNRKGPNPLTRSYESSGPDVKIRGTAHHIGEKYLQLARDAQSSGDPVTAESYLQHAEHYFRLIALAQAQQGAPGFQRQPGDPLIEDYEDGDDFAPVPDRFASPLDRFAAPQPQSFAPASAPGAGPQPSAERAFFPPQERPLERPAERAPQGSRPPYQERSAQDRPYSGGAERGYQDRNFQDRGGSERNGPDRARDQGPPRDYAPRDQDGRPPRRSREFRNEPARDSRGERAPAEEPEVVGLPAFITAPTRGAADALPESLDPAAAIGDLGQTDEQSQSDREPNGFHLRPRRRRRSKAEMALERGETLNDSNEAPANAKDPVGD